MQHLVAQFNADEQLWRSLAHKRRRRRKLYPRMRVKDRKLLDRLEFAAARPPQDCVGMQQAFPFRGFGNSRNVKVFNLPDSVVEYTPTIGEGTMKRAKRSKGKGDSKTFALAVGRALRRAAKSARKTARAYGTPMYIWQNGRVVAQEP